MSIEHWWSEEGRQAGLRACECDPQFLSGTEEAVHAICQKRAREWLERAGIHVSITENKDGTPHYYVPYRSAPSGWPEELLPRTDDLQDYDAALIGAVLAGA